MRILVVPDLHENLDFLKYIMAVEDTATVDHVVLLGDTFDPPADVAPDLAQLQRVAGTLLGFKEILGEKLHLLMGNHDLPYYALRAVCGEGTGRPNPIISNWLGHTTRERAEVIHALWDDASFLRNGIRHRGLSQSSSGELRARDRESPDSL